MKRDQCYILSSQNHAPEKFLSQYQQTGIWRIDLTQKAFILLTRIVDAEVYYSTLEYIINCFEIDSLIHEYKSVPGKAT